MKDFEERLDSERIELSTKMGKLNDFLHDKELLSKISEEEISLLEIQYSCMEGYMKVLVRRCIILGIIEGP